MKFEIDDKTGMSNLYNNYILSDGRITHLQVNPKVSAPHCFSTTNEIASDYLLRQYHYSQSSTLYAFSAILESKQK